ncbi:hypothetical protein CLU79DRAFT_833259 [Phycomyces nitens]|nr:hypothetical protein CLU79DRAFT_833259 [Phycomyces nitens]
MQPYNDNKKNTPMLAPEPFRPTNIHPITREIQVHPVYPPQAVVVHENTRPVSMDPSESVLSRTSSTRASVGYVSSASSTVIGSESSLGSDSTLLSFRPPMSEKPSAWLHRRQRGSACGRFVLGMAGLVVFLVMVAAFVLWISNGYIFPAPQYSTEYAQSPRAPKTSDALYSSLAETASIKATVDLPEPTFMIDNDLKVAKNVHDPRHL